MRTFHIFILLLTFGAVTSDARVVRGQQPDDDPNWRERGLEKLDKEIQALQKRLEASKGQLERLQKEVQDTDELLREILAIFNPPEPRRSFWLDREDYGHRFTRHQI